MSDDNNNPRTPDELFVRARLYDRSINWTARIGREIPVLMDVFGSPGAGGILDAGCGTGRQAIELSQRGYRVVGADLGEEMLAIARELANSSSATLEFVLSAYDSLEDKAGGGFDGVYCLGNALAAAGSREGVSNAIEQFAKCLRTGGRLFIQVLNFEPMKKQDPCVRGPRVATVDGREYVSCRLFHFDAEHARVINVTMFNDGGWKQQTHSGRLYPVSQGELSAWCESASLRVDSVWGGYDRSEFQIDSSTDLLLVATKN